MYTETGLTNKTQVNTEKGWEIHANGGNSGPEGKNVKIRQTRQKQTETRREEDPLP